ncbi:MAG: septum formation initiator family protein [Acidobacteriota bacterium]|nr:septum formation initiator family protein [Acidobacteriota bacterium]
MDHRFGKKKIILGVKAGIAAAVILLVAHSVFSSNGLVTYFAKRRDYNALQEQVRQERQQNQALEKQAKELKTNPVAIERYAREELHLARPNEKIYVLPNQAPAERNYAAPKPR